jgi:hypothetical protein
MNPAHSLTSYLIIFPLCVHIPSGSISVENFVCVSIYPPPFNYPSNVWYTVQSMKLINHTILSGLPLLLRFMSKYPPQQPVPKESQRYVLPLM